MPEYTKLILRSGSDSAWGREGLQRLIMWKSTREFFWGISKATDEEYDELFSEFSETSTEHSQVTTTGDFSEKLMEQSTVNLDSEFEDTENVSAAFVIISMQVKRGTFQIALIEEAKALLSYKSAGPQITQIFKKY